MSAHVDHPPPPEVPTSRRKLHRRAGACEPCRASKLKCSGETPCLRCRKRRDKPECVYRTDPKKGRSDRSRLIGSESQTDSDSNRESSEDEGWNPEWGLRKSRDQRRQLLSEGVPYGDYSMARCIDLFKSLSNGIPSEAGCEAIKKCNGIEAFDNFKEHGIDGLLGNNFDSSKSLELGLPDLLVPEETIQEMPNDLASIYKAITDIRKLVKGGMLVNAWLQVTLLVKVTETICGMGKQRPSVRSTKEVELKRRLWWLVLELEVQISIHVGQPLNVSPRFLDGVERPTLEGLDPDIKHLESSKLDFRQAALDVLGKIGEDVHAQVADEGYDNLVELINLDRLDKMQERLPQQPLVPGESVLHIAIADHRIEFFAFKMLLACVLASLSQQQKSGRDAKTDLKGSPLKAKPGKANQKQLPEYQKDILDSAMEILKNFEVIYQIQTAEDTKDWTRCFAAYSAVCILAIAAVHRKKSLDSHHSTINKVQAIFTGLSERNSSCSFAKIASARIAALLSEIKKLKPQSPKQASRSRRVKKEKPSAMDKGLLVFDESPQLSPSKAGSKKRRSSMADSSASLTPGRKKLKQETAPESSRMQIEVLSRPMAEDDIRSRTMHQLSSTSSLPHDFMYATSYEDQYNLAALNDAESSHNDATLVVPATASGVSNDEYPYLYSWFNPPLSRPHPPLLYPERTYTNLYDQPMGYGYTPYLQTGPANPSAETHPMQNAEQFNTLAIPAAWSDQLQTPAIADASQELQLSTLQEFESSRPSLGRHNSFPHLITEQMNAQVAQQFPMITNQNAQDPSSSHTIHDGALNGVPYSGTELDSSPSQRLRSRPQMARSWTGYSPGEMYHAGHVFHPYEELRNEEGR